ncbi:MAG: hypothetical protein PHV07_02255 [Oscillospiraceae bacterium]|nr:hypothetical protein [Oscillospiraceae bacterium]
MVSETLSKVILAENQAAEKVDLANEKSEQIISEAKGKVKEIIAKSKLDSKTEAEVLMQKNEVQINEIFDNYNKKSFEEASQIRTKAQAKKAKAIDMIIEKIISK